MGNAETCAKCGKHSSEVKLVKCERCHTTKYCSGDCIISDLEDHKTDCDKNQAELWYPSTGLISDIRKPFTAIGRCTWLFRRAEKDVYRLLIDTYRMRIEES